VSRIAPPSSRSDGALEVPEEPPSTRLVLVRHGEAECNRLRIVGGPRGCRGLSPLGVAQVEALARRLRSTGEIGREHVRLYSSVLPRARQTASILAPALGCSPADVVERCDLCELHPGAADGLSWTELEERFGTPDFSTEPDRPLAPGAETWTGFVERVGDALRSLVEAHQGEVVVVACHGGVVDGSLISFLGDGSAKGTGGGFGAANASLTEWRVRRGRWRLVRYNDVAHLLPSSW
jgi:probable phosphoglycerate mutase